MSIAIMYVDYDVYNEMLKQAYKNISSSFQKWEVAEVKICTLQTLD